MKSTGSLIRFWLEDWQRRFGSFKEDEIRELIFQRSFINIAKAATVELDSHYRDKPSKKLQRNSKDNWAKEFLELIESYFDNNHRVLDLISLEYESEIDALRIEIKAGSYDIAKIYPLLDKIKEGLSPATIGLEVAKQFARDGQADTNYLQSLSEFLVQSQIGRNSLSDLKDIPQQSIARLGAELFLDQNLESLAADKTLSSSLWTDYLRFLEERLKDAGNLDSVVSKDAVTAFDLLDTFYWQHLFRAFLERLAEIIAAEILNFTKCVSIEEAARKLERHTRLHNRVGKALYHEYVRILTQASLSSITDHEARSEDSQLRIDMLALGNWLREKASFTSDRHPSEKEEYYPDTLDLVVTEAFNSAAIKRVGNYAANVLAKRAKKSAIERIGARICSVLARDIRQASIDPQSVIESLRNYLSEWRSRIDLHRNLGVIFRNTNRAVRKAIPEIVTEKRVQSLVNRAAGRASLWADWKSSFISQAGFQSYIYKHFPWQKLTASKVKALLNRVFAEFDSPPEEWSVLFTVKGLDSKERMWKMGNITFYDPEAFDLRDARLLPQKPDGKTTAAEVSVKAVSTYDAARKASEKLSLAMNKTAFILSLNKTYGGFAIRIDTNVYVRRLQRNSASAGRLLARPEDPITQSVEAVEAWVTPKFDRLISIIDKQSALSELEERFLTGIHWYNKGRWKYDATEAFLYYWIGIEALFGGLSQQPLFDQMSRLEVTWRRAYGHGTYGLKRYWIDLVRMLSESKSLLKRLDNTRDLKDWNVDRRILADRENVKKVIALIPTGKKKVKDYAQQYLDYLIPFVNHREHYEKEVELLRSEFRFKLLILKDLRNSITHSGRHEHPALLLYSNELQAIFEDLLFVVGNAVIQPDPRSATMSSLIDEVNEWWVV